MKQPIAMISKHQQESDLQRDWGSSIAVKITAPVLWAVIIVGLIVAVLTQRNLADDLAQELNISADHIAYQLRTQLRHNQGKMNAEIRNWLRTQQDNSSFHLLVLSVDEQTTMLGSNEVDQVELSRDIVLAQTAKGVGLPKSVHLMLAHPSLEALIKSNRRDSLLYVGIPFFLFSFVLAWLIHIVITRPISDLVSATRAVTKGDMERRINTDRKDEFGYLGRFFNQMLDQLQDNQQQLRQAVEEAETASKSKSLFLANMSHEIRTPLTAIIGFSEMLRDDELNEEERVLEVNSIIRSGFHLQQIINDILDLSKIEAGQLLIEHLLVSPFSLLEEVEALFSQLASEKGLVLSVRYEYPLPQRITTDPTRLKQILMNLCSNAIKFTEQGSVNMLMRYLPEQNNLFVSVTDSGTGMTEEEQSRVFNAFAQADSSTTRNYGGSGLGLAISRELASRLGGSVRCESKKGIGSQFILEIDAGEGAEKTLVQGRSEIEGVQSDVIEDKQSIILAGKVLLAEDNADNRRLIGLYLRRTGVDLSYAENGAIAVDLASKEDFDLVLMDMQMPVMDGVTAIKKLRQQGFSKPIVVVTANVLAQDREACTAAGADEFLTKPVNIKRFYEVLDQYLSAVPE